jgi:hypothetical protein
VRSSYFRSTGDPSDTRAACLPVYPTPLAIDGATHFTTSSKAHLRQRRATQQSGGRKQKAAAARRAHRSNTMLVIAANEPNQSIKGRAVRGDLPANPARHVGPPTTRMPRWNRAQRAQRASRAGPASTPCHSSTHQKSIKYRHTNISQRGRIAVPATRARARRPLTAATARRSLGPATSPLPAARRTQQTAPPRPARS